MTQRKQFIEQLVLEAGVLIRKRLTEDMSIEKKGGRRSDLVTSVDFEVERLLVEKISKQFPDDSFLTEEKTVDLIESDNVWIIDPIDGTMNFIYSQRDFAISVALYSKGQPKIGVVYDVMADEIIIAQKGLGVTINNVPVEQIVPVELKQSIVDVSLKSIRNLKINGIADLYDMSPQVLSNRNIGSAAIRIAHIGLNRAHVYINDRLSIWDVAAAMLIVDELGGTHNFKDVDLKYNSDSFFFMGANNQNVYDEIKRIFFK